MHMRRAGQYRPPPLNCGVRRMKETSRKLQFALDVEGGWPPVSSEAVWCDVEGTEFRLRNAPFFIKGLAVDDVFEAVPDPVNGHIIEFKVTRPSSHSLAWMINNTKSDRSE